MSAGGLIIWHSGVPRKFEVMSGVMSGARWTGRIDGVEVETNARSADECGVRFIAYPETYSCVHVVVLQVIHRVHPFKSLLTEVLKREARGFSLRGLVGAAARRSIHGETRRLPAFTRSVSAREGACNDTHPRATIGIARLLLEIYLKLAPEIPGYGRLGQFSSQNTSPTLSFAR